MADIHKHRILIVDFGSQYTQLIARRIREMGVYCEIFPYDVPDEAIQEFSPRGIILSGGPKTVTQAFTPRAPAIIFELGCPILGICYGMQTMATQLGGLVSASATHREFGYAQLRLRGHSHLFEAIEDYTTATGESLLDVWMSHGDHVTVLPQGFVTAALTDNVPIAAIADETRQWYGVQFHPEVSHTRQGKRILERFVLNICSCQALWNISNIIEEMIENCRALVGKDRVILGLSGGVDSSVVAALLHRAIGSQLTCVFVDHGMLRLGETEQILSTFANHVGVNIIPVDASEGFYKALQGVTDPEIKRKIIGKEFIKVFDAQANQLENVKWLAQGTIYPDVIESARSHTGKAHVIKTHHNVGGLPETMNLRLLEPLRELFKDEVRKLGLELGLPYDLVYRHPFPGPGLAVRILGEVNAEEIRVLQLADAIFIEELRMNDLYHRVAQAFVVLLPVKSVSVKGDARYHEPVIALRAVETNDFMTARASNLPFAFLEKVAARIVNEVPGISRVVYDITSKPPATIEWE